MNIELRTINEINRSIGIKNIKNVSVSYEKPMLRINDIYEFDFNNDIEATNVYLFIKKIKDNNLIEPIDNLISNLGQREKHLISLLNKSTYEELNSFANIIKLNDDVLKNESNDDIIFAVEVMSALSI